MTASSATRTASSAWRTAAWPGSGARRQRHDPSLVSGRAGSVDARDRADRRGRPLLLARGGHLLGAGGVAASPGREPDHGQRSGRGGEARGGPAAGGARDRGRGFGRRESAGEEGGGAAGVEERGPAAAGRPGR